MKDFEKTELRILVCGGRDFIGYNLLQNTLEDLFCDRNVDKVKIISGGATGADFLAKVFALDEYKENYWLTYQEFPANWKLYGKSAGAVRNQQMLEEGKPDLVVAFPGNKGTADMIARARKAGIEVMEVAPEQIT